MIRHSPIFQLPGAHAARDAGGDEALEHVVHGDVGRRADEEPGLALYRLAEEGDEGRRLPGTRRPVDERQVQRAQRAVHRLLLRGVQRLGLRRLEVDLPAFSDCLANF